MCKEGCIESSIKTLGDCMGSTCQSIKKLLKRCLQLLPLWLLVAAVIFWTRKDLNHEYQLNLNNYDQYSFSIKSGDKKYMIYNTFILRYRDHFSI